MVVAKGKKGGKRVNWWQAVRSVRRVVVSVPIANLDVAAPAINAWMEQGRELPGFRIGIKLKKSGKELRGKCPIHQGEGTDIFHANREKNIFHCFSCKARGNVLDFVAAMEKRSVREAAVRLQDWFTVTTAATEKPNTEPVAKPTPADESGGEGTVINPPLTFQLKGIDPSHRYLSGRGITSETAEDFGVGFYSGRGSMAGRIVIPIHNERGELLAYVGRAIDGSEPKYKFPGGFKKSYVLFDLHRVVGESDTAIVVEGYFDCMKVWQAGFLSVVALMGCSMSEQQEQLLARSFRQVVLLLEGDEAGRTGTDECLVKLGRKIWTRALALPDGKQPDQMEAEELAELLRGL